MAVSPCSTATLYAIAKIWKQLKWPSVNKWIGNSLAFQWLRIHQPIQGTQVQSLVQEDPIHHGATKPTCCNYRGRAYVPRSCALQQGKPLQWEAHPPQQRAAPAHHNERKPARGKEHPTQPKTEETYLKKKKKDEWIKKLRLYTHNGILFSHKQNDILDKKDKRKKGMTSCYLPQHG